MTQLRRGTAGRPAVREGIGLRHLCPRRYPRRAAAPRVTRNAAATSGVATSAPRGKTCNASTSGCLRARLLAGARGRSRRPSGFRPGRVGDRDARQSLGALDHTLAAQQRHARVAVAGQAERSRQRGCGLAAGRRHGAAHAPLRCPSREEDRRGTSSAFRRFPHASQQLNPLPMRAASERDNSRTSPRPQAWSEWPAPALDRPRLVSGP